MRFRFTIRDLLWLMALVAMGLGWWAYSQRATTARYEVLERTNINHNFSQLFLRDRETGQVWCKAGDIWIRAQLPAINSRGSLPGGIDAETLDMDRDPPGPGQ
jgi:hypothetical protein